jgi:hypothetical protein
LVIFIEVFMSFQRTLPSENCLKRFAENSMMLSTLILHQINKLCKFILYLWYVEFTCIQDVCDTSASMIWWCPGLLIAEQMWCWQVKTLPLHYLTCWHV